MRTLIMWRRYDVSGELVKAMTGSTRATFWTDGRPLRDWCKWPLRTRSSLAAQLAADTTAHLLATRSTTVGLTLHGCTWQGYMERIVAGLEVQLAPSHSTALSPCGEGKLQAGKTDDRLRINVPLLVSQDASARPWKGSRKGVERGVAAPVLRQNSIGTEFIDYSAGSLQT
jgi:hypothetical protein